MIYLKKYKNAYIPKYKEGIFIHNMVLDALNEEIFLPPLDKIGEEKKIKTVHKITVPLIY